MKHLHCLPEQTHEVLLLIATKTISFIPLRKRKIGQFTRKSQTALPDFPPRIKAASMTIDEPWHVKLIDAETGSLLMNKEKRRYAFCPLVRRREVYMYVRATRNDLVLNLWDYFCAETIRNWRRSRCIAATAILDVISCCWSTLDTRVTNVVRAQAAWFDAIVCSSEDTVGAAICLDASRLRRPEPQKETLMLTCDDSMNPRG